MTRDVKTDKIAQYQRHEGSDIVTVASDTKSFNRDADDVTSDAKNPVRDVAEKIDSFALPRRGSGRRLNASTSTLTSFVSFNSSSKKNDDDSDDDVTSQNTLDKVINEMDFFT